MFREEDKRNFKRYKSKSECELVVGTVTYRGNILDYSDGAGVVLETGPKLSSGDRVVLRVFDHELEFEGEIAWVREVDGKLLVGVSRTNSLKGKWKDFRISDVLIGISRTAKTGVLEITTGSIVKKIYIKTGDLVFASSNQEDDRLGEYLLKKGRITLKEFEQASRTLIATKQKLGKILVDLECIKPRELFQEVRDHVKDLIVSLFTVEDGSFEFQEGPASDQTITLQLSAANIIYSGIKAINNYVLLKKICPSEDDVLNLSDNPVRIFQALDIEDADKKVLVLINGINPLKKVLERSPLKDIDTLKTVSALLNIGLINIKGEGEAPVNLAVEEIFEKQEAPSIDFSEEIEEMHSICLTMGYYEILGVAGDATKEEIGKAYFSLSKKFHPDRHFYIKSTDIKDRLLKITYIITEAYECLSDPEKRNEYNRSLSREKSEVNEETEASQVHEVPEVTEVPEEAEKSQVHEVPEVTEVPEEAEKSQVYEVPEVTEVPEEAEKSQVYEVPEVTEVPEEAEASQVYEVPEVTEVPAEAEASQSYEVPEVTEVPEEAEKSQVYEVPEVTEVPEEAEKSQVYEVPEVTEVPQETEASQVYEVPEVTEVPEEAEKSQVYEVPEVTEVPEEAEASQVYEVPEVTEVPEEAEASQVYEVPEVTEVPQETEASQVYEVPEVTEVPEETEASQVYEVPEVTEVPEEAEKSQVSEAPITLIEEHNAGQESGELPADTPFEAEEEENALPENEYVLAGSIPDDVSGVDSTTNLGESVALIRPRRSRVYWPFIMTVILVLVISIPVIEDELKIMYSEHMFPPTKEIQLPPSRDKAFSVELSDADGSKAQGISFRDQAFRKVFRE